MTTASRDRAAAVAIIAGVALLVLGIREWHAPDRTTDFDQLWHAVRAFRGGHDPYGVVGPGRAFEWDWPLFYPFPAVLLVFPLSYLPVSAARIAFGSAMAAVLGWSMARRVVVLWPLALSAAYMIATARSQWSPGVLAGAWIPALAWLAMLKPSIGLAAFAPYLSRPRSLLVGATGVLLVYLAATLVHPGWIASWRAAVADAPDKVAPIAAFPGWALALAALRWRRPEARLLLVLSCVPHTPSVYDLVPLFFVCRTLRDSLGLALLTHVAFWVTLAMGFGPEFTAYADQLGRVIRIVVYLPCLVAVLLRPNVDEPPIIESKLAWKAALPQGVLEVTMFSLLFCGAFFLAWLPISR